MNCGILKKRTRIKNFDNIMTYLIIGSIVSLAGVGFMRYNNSFFWRNFIYDWVVLWS